MKIETTLKPACSGDTWGRCGALGDALRRLSETEQALSRSSQALLEARAEVKELEERLRRFTHENLMAHIVAPAELHGERGCPVCSDVRCTTRSLKADAIEAGWVICTHCYTSYRRTAK